MILEIIYLIAIANLAIQIAYHSTLADSIKSFFKLDILSSNNINKLSKFLFWNKLILSEIRPFLFPVILLLVMYFKLHYFVLKLINCPYCLGFHLTWLWFYFSLDYTLLISFCVALLNITIIGLNEKIINE